LHCAGSTDEAVTSLARQSPNLKRLDLGVMATEGVSDVGLRELAEHCRLLEHLDLRGCKRVTLDGVVALVQACGPTLKTLVLHSCNIGNNELRSIGEHCSGLEALDIHRCTGVSNEGIRLLVTGPANTGRTLRHLDMSNLSIGDEALQHLATARVQLESLDLRSCKQITGKGLLALMAVTGTSLRRLDLNGCLNIDPASLFKVAELCRGVLRELEIGARDEDCRSWTSEHVARLKQLFGRVTMVHDAFDFPTMRQASAEESTTTGHGGAVAASDSALSDSMQE
jgi:hypothetical protein